jgi:hypothetical protein
VQYAVIFEGKKYGDLEVVVPKPKNVKVTTKPKHPRGFFHKHFFPYLKDLQPGKVTTVPLMPGVDTQELRGALAGYTSHHWGNGNSKTKITEQGIQVFRLVAVSV